MVHLVFSSFAAAALLAVPVPSLAQRNLAVAPAAASEQRVALVIGNAAYKESPLRNPVNDARDIAQALRGVGFQVTQRTNANRRQMVEAVREFGNQLKRGGVGFFYYAGHGVQNKAGRNYLVPVGAAIESEADYEFEAMDANLVLAQMEEAGNRVNIVVLDACRDNPFGSRFRSLSRGLAQMQAAAGSFVAYSTAPGSVASDGDGRNGLYTRHLLASLKHPDTRLEEVFKRVRQDVAKETGNRQIPWDSSSVIGDFFFRAPSGGAQVASVAPAVQAAPADPSANDRALWDSVKDSRNPEELKAYLDRFPAGLFAAVAQARLRAMHSTQVATVAPSVQALAPGQSADDLQRLAAGTVFRDCADCPEMVLIPPGSFDMGSPDSKRSEEGPVHSVMLARAFGVGRFEVTRAQFARFVQETKHSTGRGCYDRANPLEPNPSKNWRNPGFAQTDNDPVVCVSWNDAKAYTQWLSRKTGKAYRLLTEAEWEYAARAGSRGSRPWGENPDDTCRYENVGDAVTKSGVPEASGWVIHNCADGRAYTAPAGSYPANAFGLHDMIGNASEWTEDCWRKDYAGAPSDGSAVTTGNCDSRVSRGGNWAAGSFAARSTYRFGQLVEDRNVAYGFRVARTH